MQFRVAGTDQTLTFTPSTLIIAGFTGKNRAVAEHHIKELEQAGIAAPDSIPSYYVLGPELLASGTSITAPTAETSGEVEPVLLCTPQGWYVAVGSDHTARDLERISIMEGKRTCAKLIGTEVWPWAQVERHWDQIVLRSWTRVEGAEVLYQEGPLSDFLPVSDILAAYDRKTGEPTEGTAIFLGTVPLRPGRFLFSDWFQAELHNTATGERLQLAYNVAVRG